MSLNRRNFIKLFGSASTVALAGAPFVSSGAASEIASKNGRRVVVIGGGFGGTVAAKYIRMLDPSIEVVLIERARHHVVCPFSNLYIAGLIPDLSPLTIAYDQLVANHGVKLVIGEVTAIDSDAKKVVTSAGSIQYDRLIVSPGIDFLTDGIEGYDDRTAQIVPHAWKAGDQSTLLHAQLQAMPDGGKVIISMPQKPYRCPPGPYERACLIATYLRRHKPKSKVIMLDANPNVASKELSMKPLYVKAWDDYYKDIFEYIPGKKVTIVDAKSKTLFVDGGERFSGDVVNFIPPQRAGDIAFAAGLVGADKRWCPVDQMTFESTLRKNIHVIGDSCSAGPMVKSGYSANSQAKVCATNVVALLNGKETIEFSGINVCYSDIGDKESVSLTLVYRSVEGKIASVPEAGGISPADFSLAKLEHTYAESWLKNIMTEMST